MTLVTRQEVLSSPALESNPSRRCPVAPAAGYPLRTSLSPGASMTIIMSGFKGPCHWIIFLAPGCTILDGSLAHRSSCISIIWSIEDVMGETERFLVSFPALTGQLRYGPLPLRDQPYRYSDVGHAYPFWF